MLYTTFESLQDAFMHILGQDIPDLEPRLVKFVFTYHYSYNAICLFFYRKECGGIEYVAKGCDN